MRLERSAQASVLRGFVESRGPDFISGWAWRPDTDGPVTLQFKVSGRLVGECQGSGLRPDLQAAGLAEGRAGFAWRLPIGGQAIDPDSVRIFEKASGEELPDATDVVVVAPPRVRGAVEVRGPDAIAGWAAGRRTPMSLVMIYRGEEIGQVRTDIVRKEMADLGVEGGLAGFSWPLPYFDPPIDPAEIEVCDEETGALIRDAGGVRASAPPLIRGVVEARGPMAIRGWARGPGGPLRLHMRRGGKRLATCIADRPRADLPDGWGGFEWNPPFQDPPLEPAEIEVREARTGHVLQDAPGVQAAPGQVIGGWVEQHGPDVISGWARGPDGPAQVRIMRGEEVLAEPEPDAEGRFHWELPSADPTYDAATMQVVEVSRDIPLPDLPGVAPIGRPEVVGLVEEASYRGVSGWAWTGHPEDRVEIEVVSNGRVIGRCTADRLRKDLASQGVGDGRHVFHWLPRGAEDFGADEVTVFAQPSAVALPRRLRPPRPSGLEAERLAVEGSWLAGRIRRTDAAEPPASVDVLVDGRFLLSFRLDRLDFDADGWAALQIEMPRTVAAGEEHRLTLNDPRTGDLIGGQERPLRFTAAISSMVELVTPLEIRGWVIDPADPDGEGRVDLYEGDRRLRRVRFGRARPEVAKAYGGAHAYEFMVRRLPLSLFDGETHQLRLECRGYPVSPQKSPRIEVRWSEDQAAGEVERFEGAVQEITASGVKGFAIDYLKDSPLELEILVDGQVVGETLADRFVSVLKYEVGHGFHGFDWRFPSGLMTGRKRKVAVRLKGRALLLPPKIKAIDFPLTALGEAPPLVARHRIQVPAAPAQAEPALMSLIVLSLNGAHVLEPLLRSLTEVKFRDPIEVVLVDHGSTDETREIVEAYRSRLRLTPLFRGVNHSFSASCNLGAALAKGQHLVMVNNDIVFTEDCLAPMRDLLDASPDVGLVGLRLLEPRYRGEGRWAPVVHHTGVRFEAVRLEKGEPRLYHPVEADDGGEAGAVVEAGVTAALAMIRRADFRAIGGFDEAYVYGYEDVDFALRMRGRLGKVAAARLDAHALHNRSSTREAKIATAETPPLGQVAHRAPRANLDLFLRRFSRHLPRLIQRQLVQGGEAWRTAPLRIAFVVAGTDRGPDAEAARAVGEAVRARFGWEPMLIGEEGHELAGTDVLVSLRPGFELARVDDAAPGLTTVAWDWNGSGSWGTQAEAYHLRPVLPQAPAAAAEALRKALATALADGGVRVAIKAQAENEPHAHALADALRARGAHVRIDGPRRWATGLAAADELVVAMAGVRAYAPFIGAVNALCLTPGAESPPAEALAAFDQLFEPGVAEVDAEVLLGLHDRLRRQFLGGLAD